MKNIELMTMLKGWGIVLVVFGHSIVVETLPHNFIYLFHLALFYFASGYFFKEKYLHNLKLYVWKRVKALYFPFVKNGLLFLLLHNPFCKIGLYKDYFTMQDMVKEALSILKFFGFEPLLGVFWFLKSLFVVNVGFAISLAISKRFNHSRGASIILLGCLTIIGIIASYKDFPLSKTLAEFLLLPIAALGYAWKASNKNFRFNTFAFLVSFIILLLCVNIKVEISSHKLYTNPLLFYLVSACGIYFSLCLCYLVKNERVRKVMGVIGYHTMPIFVWHLLLFRGVSFGMIQIYNLAIDKIGQHPIIPIDNYLWCWIYTFVGITLPLLFSMYGGRIFKRIKSYV